MSVQPYFSLGYVMDLICEHPSSGVPAFYADVSTGAAQVGVIIDMLRVQRCSWSVDTVYALIRVVEEQAEEPSRLSVAMTSFPIPVTLPEIQPVGPAAASAFRLGRLLFLAFLSGRSSVWGIDLSDHDFVDKVADKVSDAIEMVARVRHVSMDSVEAVLQLEGV